MNTDVEIRIQRAASITADLYQAMSNAHDLAFDGQDHAFVGLDCPPHGFGADHSGRSTKPGKGWTPQKT